MEYFHVKLSYSSAAWTEMLDKTVDFDDRMEPVRRLVRELGGSFANFSFFDDEHSGGSAVHNKHHVVAAKFVPFNDADVFAVVALPDARSAKMFTMALKSESGIRDLTLTPLTPLSDVVSSFKDVRAAKSSASYAAPGKAHA
jgi:hypothetical protein